MTRPVHSPGPWVIAHENAGNGYTIKDPQGRTIGHSCAARSRDGNTLPETDRVEQPEAKANGLVMAAGPSLLAAARHARNVIEKGFATTSEKLDAIRMLKNAITLAILDPEDVDKAIPKMSTKPSR